MSQERIDCSQDVPVPPQGVGRMSRRLTGMPVSPVPPYAAPVASPLFSTRHVAQACGCHPKTILRWERAGRIPPARQVDGKRVYSSEDINSIVAATAKPVYQPQGPLQGLMEEMGEIGSLAGDAVVGGEHVLEDMDGDELDDEPYIWLEPELPTPWTELEAGGDDWTAPHRDAKGQPLPRLGLCSTCQQPIHQALIHGEMRWLCGCGLHR